MKRFVGAMGIFVAGILLGSYGHLRPVHAQEGNNLPLHVTKIVDSTRIDGGHIEGFSCAGTSPQCFVLWR